MRSIRAYLLGRLLFAAGLVLVVSAVVVFLLVRQSLVRQFDANLHDRIRGFASILFQVEQEVSFEFSEELMPEYADHEEAAYFQLWFSGGALLERSPSLGETDLAAPAELASEPSTWSGRLPDGRSGRFAAEWLEVHHVYPEQGPERPQAARVLVVVARGRAELARAEWRLLLACFATVAILLLLLGMLARWTVQQALEPAQRLAQALARIDVRHLPPTFSVGDLPQELQPIAHTSDLLIRRVDQALERERRTTADIAHELRTPIAELLTVSEVALRNGHSQTQAAEMLATIRRVAARMGETVATLLELARLESGLSSATSEEVELQALIAEVARPYRALLTERALKLASSVPAGTRLLAPPEVLRIVLSNLLSNAFHYAPTSSEVRLTLVTEGTQWRLEVANRAPALQADQVPLLAQPFWRRDRSRTDRDHAGLGLALSVALAEHVGLTLSLELDQGVLRAQLARSALASRRRAAV